MNSKRPLAPRFLNQLDDYLLRNKPDIWSSRAHLVIYYSFLFLVFMTVAGFLVPTDPRQYSGLATWTTLVSISVTIGLVVWIIYLLRFNVFKRFGIQARFDGLKAFLLYFVSMAFLVSLPFIPSLIEMARARMMYDQKQLVRDINQINQDICLLEKDSIVLEWEASYYHLSGKEDPDTAVYYNNHRVQYQDSAGFYNYQEGADSIVRISDDFYALYQSPDLLFAEAWRANSIEEPLLTSAQLYRKSYQPYQAPDRKKLKAELYNIIRKYQTREHSEDYLDEEYKTKPKSEYLAKIRSRYGLFNVNNSLNNIFSRQFLWDGDSIPWLLRVYYYLVLGLTLLLFSFRHCTTKTYFLTWLAGAIIAILTGTFVAASNGSGITFLIILVLYYLTFLGLSLVLNRQPVRSAVGGIVLNLAFLLTPFIPLIITAIVYEIMEQAARSNDTYRWEDFHNKYLHLTIAEIGGLLLLLILVEPLFKRMYRLWYARPEN